ncbi:MAG: hypothetical protein CVU84_09115 [Firmicutes bacterium HGW-Firmicutes-1]|jgi:hypothetical protein|nr:MAG: hypothetical protein CVU84_09115 [Firmicutes bacterium HGW-Firmicutes-1]
MEKYKFSKRSFLGVMIMLVGICLFLNTMGILDENIFETYWPILLIIFGLYTLLDRSTRNSFGLMAIIIGVFYQLKILGWFFEGVNIWEFIWPTIIILVGIWFIFPKRKQAFNFDTLNNTVIFSGANIINTSQDFRGGEVTAIFGGMDVDLRNSVITTNEPIVIDAFTAFGGITFKVPDEWRVEMKGLPLLGGWDNKRRSNVTPNPSAKVVTIKCFLICGGIEIK